MSRDSNRAEQVTHLKRDRSNQNIMKSRLNEHQLIVAQKLENSFLSSPLYMCNIAKFVDSK